MRIVSAFSVKSEQVVAGNVGDNQVSLAGSFPHNAVAMILSVYLAPRLESLAIGRWAESDTTRIPRDIVV